MTKNHPKVSTDKFNIDTISDIDTVEADIVYRRIPPLKDRDISQDQPVWRIRLDLATDQTRQLSLEILDEIIMGRNIEAPNLVDLSKFGAGELGVSRQHMMLKPTKTDLYVVDLGSTNGTMCNNEVITNDAKYSLVTGDTLTLGRLQFIVHIIDRPPVSTSVLGPQLQLEDALLKIGKSITSQLDLDEVLNQIAEMAMSLTSAGETGIWLVDEFTGELFLEAQRGIQDERVRRIRLPIRDDTLVGKVIKTGKPTRARRLPGEDQIKVKTNYLVEALVYVPITLGKESLGVLAAVHREPGKQFNERDERLLSAIGDSAAVAIQNARLYEATDKALAYRVKELSALNEVSRTVSASLNLGDVYKVLVEQVNKHWPVEAVQLFLLDERDNTLTLLQVNEKQMAATRHKSNQGIIGKVASTGLATICNDVKNQPDFVAEIDGLNGRVPVSLACVPLRSNRIVGVLALFNNADGEFTDEDLNRLEVFAYPIATAIVNAGLFAEASRQRAAIQATAQALSQPLIILDEHGAVLISNAAANSIIETHMPQVFDAISSGVGNTTEFVVGDKTFLSTIDHLEELGTIIVMQDITYVKQLEKERSDLIHTLSHDMKSPLTSITGWTQLLEKLQPLDDAGQRYVSRIMEAADRMLDMIGQLLLTVDVFESAQLTQEPCDLNKIVTSIIDDVQGATLSKEIEVGLKESGDAYLILGDSNRLYHMILNLVDNAIKYSPTKSRVDIVIQYNDESITILVQDEGPGVPEEDQELIFDKYFRGRQIDDEPGAGLGLSVVRTIAEAHGGEVSVSNLSDRGAEFKIALPAALRYHEE